MVSLSYGQELRLFYLINRYGVNAGCELFNNEQKEKMPLIVLQVFLNKLKRYSKMVKTRKPRHLQAGEADDEELDEECRIAEQKIKEIDENLCKYKIPCRVKRNDVVRKKLLITWAKKYQGNEEVQCVNHALTIIDRYMADWVRDIMPTLKFVAKERRREKGDHRAVANVDDDVVYRTLKMNGIPLTVSAEAAAAYEQMPLPEKNK